MLSVVGLDVEDFHGQRATRTGWRESCCDSSRRGRCCSVYDIPGRRPAGAARPTRESTEYTVLYSVCIVACPRCTPLITVKLTVSTVKFTVWLRKQSFPFHTGCKTLPSREQISVEIGSVSGCVRAGSLRPSSPAPAILSAHPSVCAHPLIRCRIRVREEKKSVPRKELSGAQPRSPSV